MHRIFFQASVTHICHNKKGNCLIFQLPTFYHNSFFFCLIICDFCLSIFFLPAFFLQQPISSSASLLHSLASEVPFFCASPLSRSHPIFPDILHLSDPKTDCVRFSAPVCNIFDKAHLLFDCRKSFFFPTHLFLFPFGTVIFIICKFYYFFRITI